jgi:hypothetical protein
MKGELSVRFQRKRKWRGKKGKGNGILRKTKENERIIKGNGNENEGAISDGNEKGKENSG